MAQSAQIVIVGAGPSGLLTAWYLKQRGYTNVIVLEKLGRVGGLCLSMTVEGRTYDLGANYLTPAYTEIRAIAKQLGMQTFTVPQFISMHVPKQPGGHVTYGSLFNAARTRRDGTKVPLLSLFWAILRFCWKRFWLSSVIDAPTFEKVAAHDHGSLCKNFDEWLKDNDLTDLEGMFWLPITLMGFGCLDKIATAYALRFMTLKTFVSMLLKEAPLVGPLFAWPKSFHYGYQRFFERLSWEVDVRTSTEIKSIKAAHDRVDVVYSQLEEDIERSIRAEVKLKADYVIFACPLNTPFMNDKVELTKEQRTLLSKISSNSYCVTTRAIELSAGHNAQGRHLAATYPPPALGTNVPYGVAKWGHSAMTLFYTRTEQTDPKTPVQAEVERAISQLMKQMQAREVAGLEDMRTFNRYDYFQHVSPQDFADGWYKALQAQQGKNRAFFVGGATNFELIEPIAEYAKDLVAKNFPARPIPINWGKLLCWLVIILCLWGVLCWVLGPPPRMVGYAYPEASGAGQAAGKDWWQTFQAADVGALAPQPCETSGGNGTGASESIICKLIVATSAQPKDPQLPNFLASAYLWRVQSGTSPNEASDLAIAKRYAEQATANGNWFASGFSASAAWLHSRVTGDPNEEAAAYEALLQAAAEKPSFHGFIAGEQISVGLTPGIVTEGMKYEQAIDSFIEMMNACLFGKTLSKFLRLPEGLELNGPLMNVAALVMKLSGRGYCYNNPPAPYGFPATYLVRGDVYLKDGMYELAVTMYENAIRAPGFESFEFKDAVRDRITHLAKYQKEFLADSGKVHGSDPVLSMMGQSPDYCTGCHAKR